MSQHETSVTFRTIGVVGLGYIGLPLALRFAEQRIQTVGLDIDPQKVASLSEGHSYISHIGAERIRDAVRGGFFKASTNFAAIAGLDAIIICVPTPLNRYREPDLSFVLGTARTIAPHLKRGSLVVLESTSYPGTTEVELRIELERHSGLRAGTDFYLAYSPEREDPGNPASRLDILPKLVGGLTPECLARATDLYRLVAGSIVEVSSCRVAEAAKLTENVFRAVNIALVNELKMVFERMGIDIWEVIEAARTKPFGYMPFYPGPGLGGHCIPIDPFYLTWKAREYDTNTRFIELAGEINTSMPNYVVSRCVQALNNVHKAMRGSRVLTIGLSYKPDIDDDRESPSYRLMDLLQELGCDVSYFDPFIPVIRATRKHNFWTGRRSIEWKGSVLRTFDLALIATAHSTINYELLADSCPLIVDTRNAMSRTPTRPGQIWKA